MDYSNRITPDNIYTLLPGEIFVFGSNTIGRHGKGAAKTALKWGAIPGQGTGIMGRTYGIPTKGKDMKYALNLNKIQFYVEKFMAYAITHPELTFLVTEIGCGLAGYKPKDIAPLFKDATFIENVHLPRSFWRNLEKYVE